LYVYLVAFVVNNTISNAIIETNEPINNRQSFDNVTNSIRKDVGQAIITSIQRLDNM